MLPTGKSLSVVCFLNQLNPHMIKHRRILFLGYVYLTGQSQLAVHDRQESLANAKVSARQQRVWNDEVRWTTGQVEATTFFGYVQVLSFSLFGHIVRMSEKKQMPRRS